MESIAWRVLDANEEELFLLSERNLDTGAYSPQGSNDWETSQAKGWCDAFAANIEYFDAWEKALMLPYRFTTDEGIAGAEACGYVFLLSDAEARNKAFGFGSNDGPDRGRVGINTAYVAGTWMFSGSDAGDYWLLRSPGSKGASIKYVERDGSIAEVKADVLYNCYRPAVRLSRAGMEIQSGKGTQESPYEIGAAKHHRRMMRAHYSPGAFVVSTGCTPSITYSSVRLFTFSFRYRLLQ